MRYGFAVDIGTTNIEISLWNLDACDVNPINKDTLFKVLSQHPASATSSALQASIVAMQGTCWLRTFENSHNKIVLSCDSSVSSATSVAFRAIPLKTRIVRNCLYVYGADVVSRILYAHYNGVEKLQSKLVAQLKSEFDAMLGEVESETFAGAVAAARGDSSFRAERVVARAVFTGNTVMLHFLSGLSVSGFEKAPFTPVSLFGGAEPAASALASLADEVVLPPCIGAFLGADIVCASLSVESDAATAGTAQRAHNEPNVVIDVGTNTEIMLVDADGKRTACSAAAGPAFEGGGLSVEMKGSALVAELARMLDEGVMDETGYIGEKPASGKSGMDNADKRRTALNQQDVRQLQLAKGATAAAVETLLQSVGLDAAGIKKCFICGNFGNALDIDAVKKTGLLPAALAEKAVYAGNAALRGAELILLSKTAALPHAAEIAANTVVLQLADSAVFAEKYIQRMNFVEF